MKAKMFLLLSLCLGLAACNESQEVKNTPYMPYEWGNGEVYVLQFKKPEYKEYIMAYHPPYDNTCLYTNYVSQPIYPTLPIEVLDVYHQSPYIDLVDNYVLLDWKNYHFITQTYQSGYKNRMVIIRNKWDEYDDAGQQWPLENLYVTDPCEKLCNFKVDTLCFYNNGLEYPCLPKFILGGIDKRDWEEKYEYNSRRQEELEQEIVEADNAFAEYKEILIKMINEGVLEHYANYEVHYVNYEGK
ncbi:MAG: hypothetical protein MSS82_00750 [Bacteroidales bacterium]|nr:hypothetical protein [Bacteroidales bacterium]